jgi:DNA replication regulator SLD3
MRGQDESFTDASSQARQSGILTPASDSSFNHEMKPGTSRKRKREGNTVEDLLSETFVVKVWSTSVSI